MYPPFLWFVNELTVHSSSMYQMLIRCSCTSGGSRRGSSRGGGPWCAAVILVLALAVGAAAQTSPSDVEAMRAVAKALGADKTLGWDTAGDPYSPKPWAGVSCQDGRVTRIQVGAKGLKRTLAPEVRNLSELTHLEVMFNELSGPLPSLGGERGLSQLQFLLAHNCNFTAIPPGFFGGLTSLVVVDIDHNPFEPWTLPADLGGCTSLKNFFANSANVTGNIPDFFGAMPSLAQLGLADNLLSGPVPESLSGAPIQQLWLNNQGGDKLNGSISFVTKMKGLQQLWLQSNTFLGPLPDFKGLDSLQDLQLRDNQFTGPVPGTLVNLKALKKLTLTNNLLQGPKPNFPKSVVVDMLDGTERFCLPNPGVPCDPRVNLLLEVAAGFNYPKKLADGWKGNDPCNGFTGVTCNATGNITTLNFINMGLSGSTRAS